MAPAQVLPALPLAPASVSGPILVILAPAPTLAQQPMAQAQAPVSPPHTSSAPLHIFHPTPTSMILLPPLAPPFTSVTQTYKVGKEKDEVKQTITPHCIIVPMIQAGQSTEPCCSGHTSYVPRYY